jgi:hypothetical protein
MFGLYPFTAAHVTGFPVSPSHGTVTMKGVAVTVRIRY